jgi:hypothetical protein
MTIDGNTKPYGILLFKKDVEWLKKWTEERGHDFNLSALIRRLLADYKESKELTVTIERKNRRVLEGGKE